MAETNPQPGAITPVASGHLPANVVSQLLSAAAKAQRPRPVNLPSPDEMAAVLPIRLKALETVYDFKAGDLVQWKTGLKNRLRPDYSQPAIVIEVSQSPEVRDAEKLDLVLGVIADDNAFHFFRFDGRRFEPYPTKPTTHSSA